MNIIIGIILLLMVLIDYYLMKPFEKDCGFRWRVFAIILSTLNIVSGIYC